RPIGKSKKSNFIGEGLRQEIHNHLKNDPLVYKGKLPLGTILTVMDSMSYSNANIDKVTTTYYLLQGKSDSIVSYLGASNYHNYTPIKDKTYLLLDGLDHYFTKDPVIDGFLSDIAFWLDMH